MQDENNPDKHGAADAAAALTSLSEGFLLAGDYDDATRHLRQAVEADAMSPDVMGFVARLQMNDLAEAKRTALIGLEIDPQNMRCLETMALCLVKEEDHAKAEIYLRRYLLQNPESLFHVTKLLDSLWAQKKDHEAADFIVDLTTRFPADMDMMLMADLALRQAGRGAEVSVLFEGGKKAAPEEFRRIIMKSADAMLAAGCHYSAYDFYDVLWGEDKMNPQLNYKIAACLEKFGDVSAAKQHVRLAIVFSKGELKKQATTLVRRLNGLPPGDDEPEAPDPQMK